MKRTAIKRRKSRSPLAIMKDKAWKVFSAWIRNRDKHCVTCKHEGRQSPAENAGHFFHGTLDFDEENVNGQCVRCNMWLSGNLAVYASYLLDKLGVEGFRALEERKKVARSGEIRTITDYQNIIDKYQL